ncbi:MAG: stage III sporulation protein AD [Eubacteriales bacterium]|jgi:stage III sporulation protein AD|nr:stage III sporulation protein AD [Eubacteriales bacterium]HBS93761.1 stage III sporulation protein AD [Bacillota bacterium]MDD3073478.1 stage III sporulation protein AD [Eubacteriales bacterium]MDD4078747.1 stage III sporulation protein AD [Eubacteriales bacterium]MDD4768343.1 stage III sporulation protein AD [Eubacteriales bacterium]
MSIMQIVALAVVAVVLIVVIRQERPELALQISMVAGIIILVFAVWKLVGIIKVLERMALRAQLNMVFLSALLKIIGIAYIAEFGTQVCRDAGENALAFKVELAGKVMILILAVPIISTIVDTVERLLP